MNSSTIDGTFYDAIKIIVDKIKAHGYILKKILQPVMLGREQMSPGLFFSASIMKERGWFRWSVQRSEKVLIALL